MDVWGTEILDAKVFTLSDLREASRSSRED